MIDKPPGLVVHPAAGHARGTLVNALLHHCATPCRASAACAARASCTGSTRIRPACSSSRRATAPIAGSPPSSPITAAPARSNGPTSPSSGARRAPAAAPSMPPSPAPRRTVSAGRSRSRRQGSRHPLYGAGALRQRRRADRLADRVPPGDRPHPPDSRPHGPHRPPLVGDEEYGAGFRTKVKRLPEPARSQAATFGRRPSTPRFWRSNTRSAAKSWNSRASCRTTSKPWSRRSGRSPDTTAGRPLMTAP